MLPAFKDISNTKLQRIPLYAFFCLLNQRYIFTHRNVRDRAMLRIGKKHLLYGCMLQADILLYLYRQQSASLNIEGGIFLYQRTLICQRGMKLQAGHKGGGIQALIRHAVHIQTVMNIHHLLQSLLCIQ